MDFDVEIEGTFTTTVKVKAVNFKEAKIKAAEQFFNNQSKSVDYRIALVSCPVTK